jgi:hypothetical protein
LRQRDTRHHGERRNTRKQKSSHFFDSYRHVKLQFLQILNI